MSSNQPSSIATSQDKTPAKAEKRPSRLGRGLSSLMARPIHVEPSAAPVPSHHVQPAWHSGDAMSIASIPVDRDSSAAPAAAPNSQPGITYVSVDVIQPNRHQPRRNFDEATLSKLAESIKADGLMQPIIVRPAVGARHGAGDGDAIRYELVAGERRWRAAQSAGLTRVPAIVRDLDDRQLAEWALIENLQREDLNPIERAEAFQHLVDTFKLSHDQIAQQVGVERSSISNTLRLLNLEKSVCESVRSGMLSLGQAKVLLGMTDEKLQRSLAAQAIRQDWSVRRLEDAVRAAGNGNRQSTPPPGAGKTPPRAAHVRDLEQQISQQLNTKVRIRPGRKKGTGTLAIDFYSLDHFDTLLTNLGVNTG